MVDRNIVYKLDLSEEKLDQQVSELFSDKENEFLEEVLRSKVDSSLPGTILQGTIVAQIGNDVIVEVGLKSEGIVDAAEFEDEISPGTDIEVLLEDTDSEGGLVLLSKLKADRIRGWETIINTKNKGDVVTGKVIRRIKGGLLVDIGVPVFLPASQVDIRKPGDISRFIGKEVECKILKIDVEGRNIVISRRKLIEEERQSSKEKILDEIEVGQLRKGVIKNIADFGVFVDLGGLDGLLHISDLTWGRISHPSEVVELDQEIECVVIGVNKEHEKISLGLKQKTASPWENVEERYPVEARVKGKVVNVMNYGVFIRLEDGIEGLVHISEMSWTRRLAHPSEMLNLDDEIDVVVLNVNKEKQEISLGIKQTEINPWTIASQKYPPGTVVTAQVRSLTNFGAFVEMEPGLDGMIHISDLSWTKKYNHPGEALQKGQDIKCVVLEVNEEKRRISLGIKQMTEDPWARAIPEKYIPGHIIKGKIAKVTNFGAFVELEPDLEGLLHISELADHKIDKPQDIVNQGDEVEVKILRVDNDARKIGLSLRRVQWAAEEQAAKADLRKEPQGERTRPIGVETVVSDADMDQIVKPKDEATESEPAAQEAEAGDTGEPEVSAGSEQTKAEAVEAGASDEGAGDTGEPAGSEQTETEASDEVAGEAGEPQVSPESDQTDAEADEAEAVEAQADDAGEALSSPEPVPETPSGEQTDVEAGDTGELEVSAGSEQTEADDAVEAEVSEEPEQDQSEQPQDSESSDSESEAGGDSSPEKETKPIANS
ncbi:MAG: 30S ribosomal protein S1 [Planctomycetes bacterium]|nr:30S ribosomal protein S1 [Planctomycetota bacterium]